MGGGREGATLACNAKVRIIDQGRRIPRSAAIPDHLSLLPPVPAPGTRDPSPGAANQLTLHTAQLQTYSRKVEHGTTGHPHKAIIKPPFLTLRLGTVFG